MNKKTLLVVCLLFSSLLSFAQPVYTVSSGSANPGQQVSIDVNVSGFTNILSIQHTINWDPAVLSLDTILNLNSALLGFDFNGNFGTLPSQLSNGFATFSWSDFSNPGNIPDNSRFYTLVFDAVGSPCDSSMLRIAGEPLSIEVIQQQGGNDVEVGLTANNGIFDIPGTDCMTMGFEGLIITGGMETASPTETVCVPFTVTNFDTIVSIQNSFAFDPAVLRFDRVQNFGLSGLDASDFGSTNASSGSITVVWIDNAAAGVSLPDGTVLFEMCFEVIGNVGQMSPISITGSPLPIEITGPAGVDIEKQLNAGKVTVTSGQALTLTANSGTIDMGESGCIDITTTDFDNIESIQFSMSWDPAKFMFDKVENFGIPGLDVSDFGKPTDPNIDPGELTIVWISNSGNGVSLPDGSVLFTICLKALADCDVTDVLNFTNTPLNTEISANNGLVIGLTGNAATMTVSCNALTISSSVMNASCMGADDGFINIEVEGGTPNYTYLWSPGGEVTQDLTDIPAGNYSVVVTDMENNSTSQSFVIADGTEPCPMTIVEMISSDNNGFGITCSGECDASLTANVTAGIEPFTFAWSNGESTETITGLCAGMYSVVVTNGMGEESTFSAEITSPTPLEVTVTTTEVSSSNASDGTATAVVTGGVEPYTYAWNVNNEMNETIMNLPRGRVMLLVRDANGCEVIVEANISGGAPCYESRAVITPNADGANDELIIACVFDNPNMLGIYDRWGQLVYQQANYDNTWMGTDQSGERLNEGGYFWVLRVTLDNGDERIHKGHVTIIRTLD